jgi:hypothetical protein
MPRPSVTSRRGDVDLVMVNGRILLEDGELVGVDEALLQH